ncbi:DUF806 family protein [Paucilactobacillus suebicus]|uniref:Phage tail protein n=1 Tax=Paucilactobacillus suebicus DSM 5007 = KCTC 3549 TaxID=1423807 RepID=A0A0R1VV98_9LACO|nr:DUF806 family protein [Paucilactobacillus suebicus]KRM09543.1 phage tail protein [Paucilactobacillus suebicus DSM 5007 = KCTC 3549]
MELSVVQASNLIKSASYSWINNVYRGSIPESVVDDTDKTDVLITEYVNEPAYYANQTFKGWQIGVELQIFYAKDTNINFQDVEITIAKLFNLDGWQIEQSKNRIKDPDTKQWCKVFYFVKDIKGGL